MMYNSLYTALPVLVTGILDQDLGVETLLSTPRLYTRVGKDGCVFSYKEISLICFTSAAEALVLVVGVLGKSGLHPLAPALSTCQPPLVSSLFSTLLLRHCRVDGLRIHLGLKTQTVDGGTIRFIIYQLNIVHDKAIFNSSILYRTN